MINKKSFLVTSAICFFIAFIPLTELSAQPLYAYWNLGHLAVAGEFQSECFDILALEGPGIYLRSFESNLGMSITPVNFRIDNSNSDTEQIFTEMSFFWSPFNLTEESRLGLVGLIETHYSSEFFFDFKIGAEFIFSSTYFFNGNRLFPVFDIIDLGVDYSITRKIVNYHIAVDLLMVGYVILMTLQDEAQERNNQFEHGTP